MCGKRKKLTAREEEIMQLLWKMKKAFIKELVEAMPEPKPHYNTVSTMVKILKEKGFVNLIKYGNIYQVHPILTKDDYQVEEADDLVKKYFDNSYSSMIAHFATKEKISEAELIDIIKLIQSKKS